MLSCVRATVWVLLAAVTLAPGSVAKAQSEATEQAVERLFSTPAASLDPALPDVPFGAWFNDSIPKRSGKVFEITECKRKITGTQPRLCHTIDIDIVSRHRNLHLEFERDSLAFRVGIMSSAELEGTFGVESLASLPKLLKRGMRPFPLTCPADTKLNLRESYAGLFEWCEDANGTRQGPARSWFSTGIYLLDRGQFADGKKVGAWTECDRFERCKFNNYVDGEIQ